MRYKSCETVLFNQDNRFLCLCDSNAKSEYDYASVFSVNDRSCTPFVVQKVLNIYLNSFAVVLICIRTHLSYVHKHNQTNKSYFDI